MARNTDNKKQTTNTGHTTGKNRKDNTDRTSSQGQKVASGGSKNTSNQGHKRGG